MVAECHGPMTLTVLAVTGINSSPSMKGEQTEQCAVVQPLALLDAADAVHNCVQI